MKKTIEEVAEVQMGYHFRSRVKETEDGNISVIQMKNLMRNEIDFESLQKINMEETSTRHLARKGDLVFRMRGNIFRAALVDRDVENTIVGSSLLQISVLQKDLVLPEYLLWFINHRKTQNILERNKKGSFTHMLSLKWFKGLEVEIPDIAIQKKIVEITTLATEEFRLASNLQRKKTLLIQEKMMQLTEGKIDVSEIA